MCPLSDVAVSHGLACVCDGIGMICVALNVRLPYCAAALPNNHVGALMISSFVLD